MILRVEHKNAAQRLLGHALIPGAGLGQCERVLDLQPVWVERGHGLEDLFGLVEPPLSQEHLRLENQRRGVLGLAFEHLICEAICGGRVALQQRQPAHHDLGLPAVGAEMQVVFQDLPGAGKRVVHLQVGITRLHREHRSHRLQRHTLCRLTSCRQLLMNA